MLGLLQAPALKGMGTARRARFGFLNMLILLTADTTLSQLFCPGGRELIFLDKVDSKSYVSLVSKMRILRILENTTFDEAHTPREPVARLVE